MNELDPTRMVDLPVVDAVILAGGKTAAEDPLFPLADAGPKALIPLLGRPMIAYVLDALQASAQIGRIAVVGLPEEAPLLSSNGLVAVADQGGLIANAIAGIRALSGPDDPDHLILICTADLPLIKPETVAAFLTKCAPFDRAFYYPTTSREVIERDYPGTPRTYSKLREGTLTGGNVALVKASIVDSNIPFWEALAHARKYPWRMASVIGFPILVNAMLGRLSVRQIERRAEQKLGLTVQAVPTDRAEIAMDVDKPIHLELIERLLDQDPPAAKAKDKPAR